MDSSNKNEPKVIATIDVNIQMPKVDKKAWMEETLDEHFHCVLCGGELEFTHKTCFITQKVSENAHCPSCGVRNRQSDHSLQ